MAEPTTAERGTTGGGPEAGRPATSSGSVAARILESRSIEIGLATILVVIATGYLARFVHAMATTPLWNDELWSVQNFSSQGPGPSVSEPNNAIVLNLVNSLLPGSSSLDPLRVRFVSIVAVVAMQLIGLAELTRRRWYLPGALLFFTFAVNFQWLDIALQARGYGILGFCAMAAGIAAWRHLEDGRARWLVVIAAVSIVGVWTVPSFAFFAGPLWLLLIVVLRDRRVVLAAVGAGVAVLALYGPLLDDLWNQTTGYAAVFGHQYGTVLAPFRTIRNFLWEREGASPLAVAWVLAFLAPLLVAVPNPSRAPAAVRPALGALFVGAPSAARRTVWILGAASVGVMLIALALTTPPQRTVAYVVVPIALITALSIGVLRDGDRFRAAWRGFSLAAASLACVAGVFAFKDLSFTPIENWKGAADYIETTFPDGTAVYALTRSSYLEPYLDGGSHAVVPELDQQRLRDGTLVVAAFDPTDEVVDARAALSDLEPNLAQMDVAQRRGTQPPGSFPILFAPPLDRRVEHVEVDGRRTDELSDGLVATAYEPADGAAAGTMVLDVALAPSTTARSLVVPLTGGGAPSGVEVEVTAPDGSTTTIDPGSVEATKRLITVHLGDREVRSVRLTVVPAEASSTARPRDVWVYSP